MSEPVPAAAAAETENLLIEIDVPDHTAFILKPGLDSNKNFSYMLQIPKGPENDKFFINTEEGRAKFEKSIAGPLTQIARKGLRVFVKITVVPEQVEEMNDQN